MGRLQAEAMLESSIPFDSQIEWHLRVNHYPPVSNTMVPVCIQAIDEANIGEWHTELPLPEGVMYKGSNTAPVWAIVEQHHLDTWIIESELD
jgi:hypothetical protein